MNSYEFTVKSNLYNKTTCVVDILRFVNGMRIFPCGDGEDCKLTDKDIHNVNAYINNLPVKTKAGWTVNFDNYVEPGDIVEEAIIDEFMNCLPPVSMSSVCAQCGEPYSHKKIQIIKSEQIMQHLPELITINGCIAVTVLRTKLIQMELKRLIVRNRIGDNYGAKRSYN